MELLDTILRFGTIGLYIWLTIFVLRNWRHLIRGRLAAAVSVCLAAYLLCSKSSLMFAASGLDLILFPFCVVGGVVVWLFCLSQFDDHFSIRPWHWGVLGTKLGFAIPFVVADEANNPSLFTVSITVSTLIAIGTQIHLAYVTWRGGDDDLMPARKRFRSIFVIWVIIIMLGILLGEAWMRTSDLGVPYLQILQSASFFAITLFALWRMSGPDGIEIFAFGDAAPDKPLRLETPEDRHDRKALDSLIAAGIYLEPGLNIASLAERLRMPEHRLRRLINQHLGFRNFSDFLNHHRIGDAKARLARVDDRHVPILTIAMDVGYLSLGPFNRAFKERTGQTPSDYRRTAMASDPGVGEKSSLKAEKAG